MAGKSIWRRQGSERSSCLRLCVEKRREKRRQDSRKGDCLRFMPREVWKSSFLRRNLIQDNSLGGVQGPVSEGAGPKRDHNLLKGRQAGSRPGGRRLL